MHPLSTTYNLCRFIALWQNIEHLAKTHEMPSGEKDPIHEQIPDSKETFIFSDLFAERM